MRRWAVVLVVVACAPDSPSFQSPSEGNGSGGQPGGEGGQGGHNQSRAGQGGTSLAGQAGTSNGTGAGQGGGNGEKLCDPNAPFVREKKLVGINSEHHDGQLRFSKDELCGVFYSSREGDNDIFEACRPALDAPFQDVKRIDAVSLAGVQDFTPTLNPAGTILVFESFRSAPPGVSGSGGNAGEIGHLWASSRATSQEEWGIPSYLKDSNSVSYETIAPFWAEVGLYGSPGIYFTARSGSTQWIRYAPFIGGNFGKWEDVAGPKSFGVATKISGITPVSSWDGLFLFISTSGQIRLLRRFGSMVSSFQEITVLGLPNTDEFEEYPTWVSQDNCRLYFERVGVETTADIYVAERDPL